MKTHSRYISSHRSVREALENSQGRVLYVATETPVARELAAIASRHGVEVQRISRNALRGLEPQARDVLLELPENVGASASLEEALESSDSDALVLLLDHIEDPRNYGAILRSADQFGVNSILVPGKRNAPLSAATVEASAGTAQFATIVTVSNLASAIEELKEAGYWIYAAAAGGTPAEKANLTGKVALILGNEGKGVSRLVTERADETIAIPRTGHADSLNVSVAAGVLLYEVRRQQGWTVRHG